MSRKKHKGNADRGTVQEPTASRRQPGESPDVQQDRVQDGSSSAPRFPALLSLLAFILVVGAAIGGYLTWHHENEVYGSSAVTLGNCPQTETINCEAVNSSPWSEIAGMPVATLGMATYLAALVLALAGRRRPRLLAYLFGIGVLAVGFSGYLFYVSKYRIGFLCLWCLRLYAVNLTIPVLSGLAAWRSPVALVREALGDLLRWPRDARFAAAVFAGLLLLTLAGERGYRASIAGTGSVAEAPAGAGADGSTHGTAAAGGAGAGAAGEPNAAEDDVRAFEFVAPGTLQLLSAKAGEVQATPFDIRSKVGQGHPVAVMFWAPGSTRSETTVIRLLGFLKKETPNVEVYAVAGKRDDKRLDAIWELWRMMDVPADVPLLVDPGFTVSKMLELPDQPNLALVDGSGHLVASMIKALEQTITYTPRKTSAEEIIRQVAAGTAVAPLKVERPYYPGDEYLGHCAPAFTAREFNRTLDMSFTGKSKNGRPTLLVFWSSTCTHCQKEIPQLVGHHSAHPREYDIVSVTSIKPDRPDRPSHRKITEEYIGSVGIDWPVLEDPGGAIGDLYKVVSTPTTFLISPGGEVVDVWYFAHEGLDEVLDKALVKLKATTGACTPATPDPLPVPEFSMRDPAGATVALSSLTGAPALVHFWATWCGPCKAELPSLLKYRKQLEKDGGRLVLVSVEDADAGPTIEAYLKKAGLSASSYRAPQGGLADDLQLGYVVPRTYMLATGGRVTDVRYGEQPWDDPAFQQQVRVRLGLK